MSEQLLLDEEAINIVLRRAWDRALRTLATRVNKPTFETHIRAIRPLTLTEGIEDRISVYYITLGVPSAFTREWVEKRHAALISDVLSEILDRDVRLSFSLVARGDRDANQTDKTASGKRTAPPAPSLFDAEPEPAPSVAAPPAASLRAEINSPADAPGSGLRPVPRALQLLMDDGPSSESEDDGSGNTLPTEASWRRTLSDGSSSRNETQERAGGPQAKYAAQADSSRPAKQATVDPTLPAQPRTARQPGSVSPAAETPAPGRILADSGVRSGRSSGRSGADAPTLNPRYTFETFIVGHSNRLAHAGALQVAEQPGRVYNPLFLYGPSGLGKTHLMHAIGNALAERGNLDSSRIAYISGEAFTSSFVTSLMERRTDEFRRRWNSVDLWLVDDIQFIAGKERTKEEFFHTFNTLYQMGKQIVISSDRSPRELRTMDERLRSRFECGLIADIAAPDLETRLAILHRKADLERTRIPDDVLLYMARLVQSNIRTLEGALVKLVAYASLNNSPVTTEMASSILERYYIASGAGNGGGRISSDAVDSDDFGPATRGSRGTETGGYGGGFTSGVRVTPEMVQRAVARRFGLSPDVLTGKRRDREASQARFIAMHLLRELTEISLPGIGDLFGGRDHSSVLYACDKVKSQMGMDDDLRGLIDDLVLQLRAQAAG